MKLLLVEDDRNLTELLAEALTNQHYDVDVAYDGHAAWDFIKAFDYDLLVLDMLLPELNGITLCRHLRSQGYQMPILMLTARDTTQDQVAGLDAGADDYVTKPYKLLELLARIRALMRRGSSCLPPILRWGNLSLDPSTRKAKYEGHPLLLTPKEYRLLELFLRQRNRVLSRNIISDNLWSCEEPPEEEAVKAHIKRLRKKLIATGAPNNFIETVYGLGYRLMPNP